MATMIQVQFTTSWADTIAQATRNHGERGRRMATLLRAAGQGSKALLSRSIADAGYPVQESLDWAGEPYSSVGLQATAGKLYEFLAAGGAIDQ